MGLFGSKMVKNLTCYGCKLEKFQELVCHLVDFLIDEDVTNKIKLFYLFIIKR